MRATGLGSLSNFKMLLPTRSHLKLIITLMSAISLQVLGPQSYRLGWCLLLWDPLRVRAGSSSPKRKQLVACWCDGGVSLL